jgi:hypothetical protein
MQAQLHLNTFNYRQNRNSIREQGNPIHTWQRCHQGWIQTVASLPQKVRISLCWYITAPTRQAATARIGRARNLPDIKGVVVVLGPASGGSRDERLLAWYLQPTLSHILSPPFQN